MSCFRVQSFSSLWYNSLSSIALLPLILLNGIGKCPSTPKTSAYPTETYASLAFLSTSVDFLPSPRQISSVLHSHLIFRNSNSPFNLPPHSAFLAQARCRYVRCRVVPSRRPSHTLCRGARNSLESWTAFFGVSGGVTQRTSD